MTALLKVIHVFVSLFLIVSILLQSSKGGGLAGMFGGGGGMGNVFGGRGASSFLAKVTMWLGITFALTSISIALLSKGNMGQNRSMVQQVMEQENSSPGAILPTAPEAVQPQNEQQPEDQ